MRGERGYVLPLWNGMIAQDGTGLLIPDPYGGSNGTLLDACILFEEVRCALGLRRSSPDRSERPAPPLCGERGVSSRHRRRPVHRCPRHTEYPDEIAAALPHAAVGRVAAGTVLHAFDADQLIERLVAFLTREAPP